MTRATADAARSVLATGSFRQKASRERISVESTSTWADGRRNVAAIVRVLGESPRRVRPARLTTHNRFPAALDMAYRR